MQSQAELLEVVLALCSAGCLAGLLYSGEQQRNQDRNDGNHHQQFN
jgi:hypothetical protein